MKKLLTILCLFLALAQAKAQDTIVKNDKTEIKAKIEEITETTIKYKKFDMLDGPTYNINKRDVFMIIYKNGSKEYMEATPSQPVVASPQPQSQSAQDNRQPANNRGSNGNSMNSQNNNTNYSDSELITPKGGAYMYKEEFIMNWRDMNNIFVQHNAQESIRIMSNRKTLMITGSVLTFGGLIGGLVLKGTPGIISLGVALGGISITSSTLSQPKKAITAYNNMIKSGKRVSYEPTLNISPFNGGGGQAGVILKF